VSPRFKMPEKLNFGNVNLDLKTLIYPYLPLRGLSLECLEDFLGWGRGSGGHWLPSSIDNLNVSTTRSPIITIVFCEVAPELPSLGADHYVGLLSPKG